VPVINWFVRYATLHDFRLLLWCNEIFTLVGYYALHIGSVLMKLQDNLDVGNQLPMCDVLNPGRVKISIRHSFSNCVILLKNLTKKFGIVAHLV
jgi:hypothetical protein